MSGETEKAGSARMRRVVGAEAKQLAEPLIDLLVAYEETVAGPSGWQPITLLLEDPDTGAVIGGLHGETLFGWAFVRYLVLSDSLRGQGIGSRLIEEVEAFARERGCKGVWLDTFAFQARPFYEKLGYSVFGELEGGEGAIGRYFLKKVF